jgi:AP-3 complex subunit delta-1
MILQQADYDTEYDSGGDEVRRFYYEKPSMVKTTNPVKTAAEYLEDRKPGKAASYQEGDRDSLLDPEALERKRAERRERYRDDPFYIDSERNSGTSTPMHSILRSANGSDLDVDAIPVMELKLDSAGGNDSKPRTASSKPTKTHKKPKRHFEITSDETLDGGINPTSSSSAPVSYPSSPSGRAGPSSLFSGSRGAPSKKNPLEFNSAGLSALSLEENSGPSTHGNTASSKLDFERRVQEEEDLARAMREVEKKRLEMQRAAERVEEPAELEAGTVVRRKSKKKARSVVAAAGEGEVEGGSGKGGEEGFKKKKKKKKVKDPVDADAGGDVGKTAGGEDGGQEESATAAPVKPKKKKKRQVTFDEA